MNNPIIEMGKDYPFGSGPKNVQECNQMLVHKELPFNNQKEKIMIQSILHFVQSANHPNLINLINTSQEPESFHFYYQYVPLKLQPWILGVNQELTDQLQEQLLQLAQFLARSNISFEFDPNSVGLSHTMTVKYFLSEFSLDVEGYEKNWKKIEGTIKKYIEQLRILSGIKKSQSSKVQRFGSVSTNGSVSHLQQFNHLSHSENLDYSPSKQNPNSKNQKMQSLYQKIQSSKQKSLEVLLKLKANKAKTEIKKV